VSPRARGPYAEPYPDTAYQPQTPGPRSVPGAIPPYRQPVPRRRRRRVPRTLLAALVVVGVAFVVAAGLRYVPGSPFAGGAVPVGNQRSAPPPARPPAAAAAPQPEQMVKPLPVRPAKVTVDSVGWWSWALLDQRTGKISGSTNLSETSTTASLIKAWIAADYLRRAAEDGETPSQGRMKQVAIMIRDSDNDAAQALWSVVGEEASTKRMIKLCRLTDSKASSNWSTTRMSPRDITRLGACIADGRAAGPEWTTWLLNEMRLVRGVGDFGIRKAFPPELANTIAIKNGWVVRDNEGNYHVSCMAVGDGWTMGVMTRYPAKLDYTYGARICEDIARQLRR
jgi:hypothetical protein